jgi:hypothetical protein
MEVPSDMLGFGAASERDEVFRQVVLARMIEPSSKLDAALGYWRRSVQPCPYPTLKRRLPVYFRPSRRQDSTALRSLRPCQKPC